MLNSKQIINALKEGHILKDSHSNTAHMVNGIIVKRTVNGKEQVNARLAVGNEWEIADKPNIQLEDNKYYMCSNGDMVRVFKNEGTFFGQVFHEASNLIGFFTLPSIVEFHENGQPVDTDLEGFEIVAKI